MYNVNSVILNVNNVLISLFYVVKTNKILVSTMELLKKLIRSLARQLKEVKEAAVGNNIPEAAVIRKPVKEYAEEEAAAERRLEEGDGNPDRLHCKRTKIFQSRRGLFLN